MQRATTSVAISEPVLGCIERKKCNLRFRALPPIDPMAGHSMFTKGTGIALALLSFLILGAAFLQNIGAGVVVFMTGMIMAPPFVSGLLVCVPVWWAQNARWPWRVAATLPAV